MNLPWSTSRGNLWLSLQLRQDYTQFGWRNVLNRRWLEIGGPIGIRTIERISQFLLKKVRPGSLYDDCLSTGVMLEDGRTVGVVGRHKRHTQMHAWKTANVTCDLQKTSGPISVSPPESSISTPSVPLMEPPSLPGCIDPSALTKHRHRIMSSRSPHSSCGEYILYVLS